MNIPGFTAESLTAVQEMLYGETQWERQFLTGKSGPQLPRENKTTAAPSLQSLDIDSRPGKQRGKQGKQKDTESEALYPVALPTGNPQQGPRSRSDLKGLAMFEEIQCPKPKPRKPQELKPVTPQTPQNNSSVTPNSAPTPPKPQDAAALAERQKKREACSQKQGAGQGAGVGVTYEEACKPAPQPRTPRQREATQQASQAAQQQGVSFDSMPRQQVQEMGRQGGQADRKKTPPTCPK